MQASGKVFRGGIPLRPDVERLTAALGDLQRGDFVGHDRIGSILGEPIGSNRFRTVVAAWRRRMFRERGMQIVGERGAGYRVLTPGQATAAAVDSISRLGRAAYRIAARVDAIDPTSLTDHEKQSHTITRRHAHLLTDMARTATREIALAVPAPVTALPRPGVTSTGSRRSGPAT